MKELKIENNKGIHSTYWAIDISDGKKAIGLINNYHPSPLIHILSFTPLVQLFHNLIYYGK